MPRIAIFAFGSLIEEPGRELGRRIRDRVERVQTPFAIEYARKSRKRGFGPTLVPVEDGGSSVNAVLLELDPEVGLDEATTLLWRREIGNEFSEKQYTRTPNPGPNRVLVESIEGFRDFDFVLYTRIGRNIRTLTPDHLAELAIRSARGEAGATGTDGIRYLESAMRHGISTPLAGEYESAILRKSGAMSLDEAHSRIRQGLA